MSKLILISTMCLVLLTGFMLLNTDIMVSSMKDHYENVPTQLNITRDFIKEHLDSNMTDSQKISLIESSCRINFPVYFGSSSEATYCSNIFIEEFVNDK